MAKAWVERVRGPSWHQKAHASLADRSGLRAGDRGQQPPRVRPPGTLDQGAGVDEEAALGKHDTCALDGGRVEMGSVGRGGGGGGGDI